MSDFQRSLQFQGRNLQRQWQEKPLLRMAIWSLCLLLVVHLVMLSMDWREERGEEYRRLAGEWLKLQDVSRQTAWPERAMQAKQVLNLQRALLAGAECVAGEGRCAGLADRAGLPGGRP